MAASSSTSSASDPYEGISEFELPTRARLLATKIIWELVGPCQKRLDIAKTALEQERSKRESELNEYLKTLQNLREQLNRHSSSALSYLQLQKVGRPEEAPKQPTESRASLSEVREDIATINGALNALTRMVPPPLWPRRSEFRWAAGLTIVILAATVPPRPYLGGFLYPIIALWARSRVIKQMQERYSNLSRQIAVARVCIDNLELTAKKGFEETVALAAQRWTKDMAAIEEEFSLTCTTLHNEVEELWRSTVYAGAEWDSPVWETWTPDPSPEFAARLGVWHCELEDLQKQFSKLNFSFKIPALLPFATGKCLLISAPGGAKRAASGTLLAVMVRVLANTPPGKARFVFVDPVALGSNVVDFMHLGDFSKELITGKAWSEPQQIEQQLSLLTEHIETVIQTCLRNEFASIREYNSARKEVAQPFRFLVINDFPANFSDSAARRLLSIVQNGPRCGVFTFIVHDCERTLPHGFNMRSLTDQAINITFEGERQNDNRWHGYFSWNEKDLCEFDLKLDEAPPLELTKQIVRISGEQGLEAMKIDVPFEKLVELAELSRTCWRTSTTKDSITVPLGPAGARALQELKLGGDQEAHALLVGRTGSGKTNLMHVMITTMAIKYSPDELQLYLVDFKGGVGFKRYAEKQMPHARVIAIESEREFGISVLQALDDELKQRSELFRAAGVDNLATYRTKTNGAQPLAKPLPRILLVVDEFQEFFMENDDLAQQAKSIFERLARQGRSFGIHFLLATQSLAGSAQLPASIMGQVKVRIALPCSEADSRLILSDDNKAARSLSLPGEAIYNPLGGLIEGNNRFQVARFSDSDLTKYIAPFSEAVPQSETQIIFEGNEPAALAMCKPLRALFEGANWPPPPKSIQVFLGEPLAILPSVAVPLRRQSGANLMILTRDEQEGIGLCLAALLSIIAQVSPKKSQIVVADFTSADSEWNAYSDQIAGWFPTEISVIRRQRDFGRAIAEIARKIQVHGEESPNPASTFLFLQGLHRIKSLRDDTEDEDGNNSVELLKGILRDGPESGVHVIAWGDTWGNITRGLDRKTIGEFGLRVAAVMDSSDSMNFLDSMAASKILKSHRALLYNEDRPGQLVGLRPYALPTLAWLKETGKRFQARPV